MPPTYDTPSSNLPMAQPISVLSEPVNIPASPVRRSPSRQSSRDSLDEEEEEECDPETEIDGMFHHILPLYFEFAAKLKCFCSFCFYFLQMVVGVPGIQYVDPIQVQK